MKKCPFCGTVIEDDATRCPQCKAGIPHEEKKTEPEPEKVKKRRSE